MIGQLLGGRYEIIDRLGGGGMAIVYKGHDILLNRKVAVKVLRQQYVHDEEFIRRFRREAQAAASLSHPNVVSIYDVGQEDETHYIVMEYVEGKTLNDVIKEKAPMQVEEAIRIASQICDALDHAHQNRIIHRDIKPHNILIGKNGRVKVTDFGIARAADSSQITQTGSVVGSVHYFSPEHAKGTTTGAKSDLYSLGIVLYQMLTGKLPFLGESPISVALKHLQEDVEEPRKVNPLIPQSVENIILKSMRKNPDERYRSAKEMLHDLDTCLLPERRNEPKIAYASDHEDDQEKTRVIPAIRGDTYARGYDEEGRSGGEEIRRKRRWVKPAFWTIFTVGLLAAMWFGVLYVQNLLRVPEVDVPNLVGKPVHEAEKALENLQLHAKIVTQPHDTVAKDIVISQDPEPMRVKINNTVTLYVSLGPEMVKMPDWTGKNINDVMKTDLVQLGVKEEQVKREEVSGKEEPGTIIKQSPAANEEIDPKKVEIKLTVSKGLEQFPMPDLIGLAEVEAKSRALQSNLKLVVEQAPSYKQPKGKVFDQFPFKPKDPVSAGSEVKIFVSTGYPPEAREVNVTRAIAPAEKGKESSIRIVYSDARGDNIEWGTRKITDTQTFDVTLVLSPEKDGTIQYFRDGSRLDIQTVPYPGKNAPMPGTNRPGETGGQTTVPGAGTPPGNKPASTSPSGGADAGSAGSGRAAGAAGGTAGGTSATAAGGRN